MRRWLGDEAHGGALILAAASLALLWANSPWRATYDALSTTVLGPARLGLDLSISARASDGLLAVFFLVVGVELKQEFVTGSLRDVRAAAVPVLAAVGGMVTPAVLCCLLVTSRGEAGALHGWAIPTATDIAVALAVLSVCGRGLPGALRTFLLTLAVVDDLLAIIVIAVFYSSGLHWTALVGAVACIGVFTPPVRSRRPHMWALVPMGLAAWILMHASGMHPRPQGS
ncbi:MAG: Na+/H+ antiporter NhaA [Propionibacterium sp.]|nr:Na+/H+ antiporter NhaA [Propionibacterium sp.]